MHELGSCQPRVSGLTLNLFPFAGLNQALNAPYMSFLWLNYFSSCARKVQRSRMTYALQSGLCLYPQNPSNWNSSLKTQKVQEFHLLYFIAKRQKAMFAGSNFCNTVAASLLST